MAVGNRRQVAESAMYAHVVVPEYIVVEPALQLRKRAEGAARHKLRLEYAVGRLGHRVVVGAALAAQRAAYAEGADDPVDALILELAAPVGMENGYPVKGLPNTQECPHHQLGVLAPAAGFADDLPVMEVYDKANIVPLMPHPHIGQVAYRHLQPLSAAEFPVHHVGHILFIYRALVALELPLAVFGDKTVFLHYVTDIPSRYGPVSKRPLDLPGAIAISAVVKNAYDLVFQLRVVSLPFLFLFVIVEIPAYFEQGAHGADAVFLPVCPDHGYLLAMIRAACFKISFSILSFFSSLRSAISSFSSGLRLSFA